MAQFASRVLGPAATVGDVLPNALCYAPAYTIQGGMSAIMRNILGERVLKLPPRTDIAAPGSSPPGSSSPPVVLKLPRGPR